MKKGIMLDYNVILGYCLEGNCRDFFYFLEDHPNLARMTRKVFDNTKHILKRNRRGRKYVGIMAEYEKLPQYVKIQETDHMEKQKAMTDVKQFYESTILESRKKLPININTVSSRYKDLVKQISVSSASLGELQYLEQKIAFSNPEIEDKFLLADAILMPCEKKYIASNDGHFSDEFISRKIEERFGIICRHPSKILAELRR
jgi:hypothetical protein